MRTQVKQFSGNNVISIGLMGLIFLAKTATYCHAQATSIWANAPEPYNKIGQRIVRNLEIFGAYSPRGNKIQRRLDFRYHQSMIVIPYSSSVPVYAPSGLKYGEKVTVLLIANPMKQYTVNVKQKVYNADFSKQALVTKFLVPGGAAKALEGDKPEDKAFAKAVNAVNGWTDRFGPLKTMLQTEISPEKIYNFTVKYIGPPTSLLKSLDDSYAQLSAPTEDQQTQYSKARGALESDASLFDQIYDGSFFISDPIGQPVHTAEGHDFQVFASVDTSGQQSQQPQNQDSTTKKQEVLGPGGTQNPTGGASNGQNPPGGAAGNPPQGTGTTTNNQTQGGTGTTTTNNQNPTPTSSDDEIHPAAVLVPVYGNPRPTFSLGIFFTSVIDPTYFNQNGKVAQSRDEFSPVPGTLINGPLEGLTGLSLFRNFYLSVGIGVRDTNPTYLLGISYMVGSAQRFGITVGVAGTTVKRLNGLNVGDTVPASGLPDSSRVFRTGGFFGMTYNF